jgi:hypothetical protein
VGGIVVEDDVDHLAGRHIGVDGIEEADELLMAVALHAAADDLAIEYVERGEQRGGAVALVIVGHSAGAAFLHRQAGLGAVECLDLALLVDREHDGVGRRINVEADHVAQLVDELRIGGELELPHPVRAQPVRPPDALHRTDGDAGRLGHQGGGPVGRLAGRLALGQRDDPRGHLRSERRDARGAGLVAQQAGDTLRGEALLPAPHAGLRLARPAHDRVGAEAIGAEQHDPGPPDVLLGGVAVRDQRLQTATLGGCHTHGDSRAHRPDSHAASPNGIPLGFNR